MYGYVVTSLVLVLSIVGSEGGQAATNKLVDGVVQQIADQLGPSLELDDFHYRWGDRTYLLWKEKCSLDCRNGNVSSLSSLERTGDSASYGHQFGAALTFSGMRYWYWCILQEYFTGEEHYEGNVNVSRVAVTMTGEDDTQTGSCMVKIDQIGLTGTQVDIDPSVYGLTWMNTFTTGSKEVIAELSRHIGNAVSNKINKFSGKVFTLPYPCGLDN